jgi:tagatose-6-phosphate ketose/aldose isomerase
MSPALAQLVELNETEKEARGLAFTPREIAQQPETWKGTREIFLQNQPRIDAFLTDAGVFGPFEERPVVMLIGAGTSDYIGKALQLLLQKCWGCVVMACPSTDLLVNLEDYVIPGRRYLWISFSRSGDSPEGVAVLERAIELYPEVAHLIVTCNTKARMAQVIEAAHQRCVVVLDDAVNDRSLAMTSSFTNMIIMGQCLAHTRSIDEYVGIHHDLVRAGEDLLLRASQEAARLATPGMKRACFVGSGALASVAQESALKLLELTAGQVKTMSETILGLRHGPMAALDIDTLFVCFVSGEPRKALYARDLLIEISGKQIVQERVAIGLESTAAEIAPHCDVYLSIPDEIPDLYRPVLDILFGQSLGLFRSVALGLKPDAPSPGGVISRVVGEFQIH